MYTQQDKNEWVEDRIGLFCKILNLRELFCKQTNRKLFIIFVILIKITDNCRVIRHNFTA